MKVIKKFEAFDGEIFGSEEACLLYEEEIGNKKKARKRQLLKNEALNKIRKICRPSYNVPMVEVSEFYSNHTRSIYTESREEPIMGVIKQLNKELSKLNNRNNKWKQ